MEKEFFDQVIAEILESQSVALGIIVQCVSHQIDQQRLRDDLVTMTAAIEATGRAPGAVMRLMAHPVSALDAAISERAAKH